MTRGHQTRVLRGWPEICVSYAEAGSKGIENTIGRPSSLTFTLKLETALSLLRASSRAMSQAYANAATSSLSVAECSACVPFSHAYTVKKYSGIGGSREHKSTPIRLNASGALGQRGHVKPAKGGKRLGHHGAEYSRIVRYNGLKAMRRSNLSGGCHAGYGMDLSAQDGRLLHGPVRG